MAEIEEQANIDGWRYFGTPTATTINAKAPPMTASAPVPIEEAVGRRPTLREALDRLGAIDLPALYVLTAEHDRLRDVLAAQSVLLREAAYWVAEALRWVGPTSGTYEEGHALLDRINALTEKETRGS